MNTSESKPKLNRQIVEEAAEWFVEFSTGDADLAARQRFDEWLRMSPEHVRAYLEILPIWEDGAVAPPGQEVSPELLIAWAQGADNVVPLDRVSRAPRPSSPAPGMTAPDPSDRICPAGGVEEPRAIRLPDHVFSRRRFATAASILLVCAGGGVFAWHQIYRAPTYATDVGEQRSIVLADGSTIELNARSRVRIRFTEQERDIDLLQGQALFSVAKDHERPFIVRSDKTRVRAVGTQFDVYRRTTGTTVTVLEGRVAVLPTGSEDFSLPASFSATHSPLERAEMSDSLPSRKERVPKAREAPSQTEAPIGSNTANTPDTSATYEQRCRRRHLPLGRRASDGFARGCAAPKACQRRRGDGVDTATPRL